MTGSWPTVKPLTTKESEVLILLWAYSDDGLEPVTVNELHVCAADVHIGNEDDWTWHDYTPGTLGNILRFLEARSLVISDDRRPASWCLTELGHRYMTAHRGDEGRVVQEGYEWYLTQIGSSHCHASIRVACATGERPSARLPDLGSG